MLLREPLSELIYLSKVVVPGPSEIRVPDGLLKGIGARHELLKSVTSGLCDQWELISQVYRAFDLARLYLLYDNFSEVGILRDRFVEFSTLEEFVVEAPSIWISIIVICHELIDGNQV